MSLVGPLFDNAREIHSHHGADVGDAELAAGDVVVRAQLRVECDEEPLQPRQSAVCQLRKASAPRGCCTST